MNQHRLIGLGGPANDFAMNGLAMHFAHILMAGGHTLPSRLFMDVLLNKAEKSMRVHQDPTYWYLPYCEYQGTISHISSL